MPSKWDPEYSYKENSYYKEYEKLKNKIKEKYPSHLFDTTHYGRGVSEKTFKEYVLKGDDKLYREYIKELTDLMFEPDGVFQQFMWEVMSENDKMDMERKARGRTTGNGMYSWM